MRSRSYRKKRNRHQRHRGHHYINQSLSSLHKQGCSDSSTTSKNSTMTPPSQTRDQCNNYNKSAYQLQLSTGSMFSAESSPSAKPSFMAKSSLSTVPSSSTKSST